jgi:hypothetical protein
MGTPVSRVILSKDAANQGHRLLPCLYLNVHTTTMKATNMRIHHRTGMSLIVVLNCGGAGL